MKHTLVFANIISLAIVLIVNYLSNTDLLFTESIGEVSDKYSNLFVPASYAFSIWGIIYLALIWSCVYQWRMVNSESASDFIERTSWYFVIANIGNALWVLAWLSGNIGFSVIIMLFIFGSLLMIFIRNRIALDDPESSYIAGFWWPIMLYFGWITTALIANISAYLTSIGWNEGVNEPMWAIVMIAVAAAVYIFMVWHRNARIYSMVGVWSLSAIYVARNADGHSQVATVALVCAILIFVSTSIHAFRNRTTLPFMGRK